MRGRFLALLAVVCLVVSPLASTGRAYSSASEEAQDFPEDDVKTLDDRFAEIARQVPGFGGMFYDESGQLTMYLVTRQEGDEKMAEQAKLARDTIATLWSDDPRIKKAGEIRVLPGKYGFLRLKKWHDRMSTDVLGLPGVVLTDIDEIRNRVRIGIENEEVQSLVEEQLVQLGIPLEAVIIEVTEPFQATATLRETQRPVIGGLQIKFKENLLVTATCTLGFIANRAGVTGMVTNSHCTKTQGGVEKTNYHQATPSGTTNRIGQETVDPAYMTGGRCPEGRKCRYSDAAFAKIPHPSGPSVQTARGFIARTTGFNNNSLTIDPAKPRFRIVAETSSPFVGQILNKVGRTTGWTQGAVSSTCINADVSDSDITMLCQSVVDAKIDSGDSGSPVFEIGTVTFQSSVNVSSLDGWQETPLILQQGNQYSISYNGGTWTVDHSNFEYVDPEGYPPEIDEQIFQGCKIDSSLPYARLLGRVGGGETFSVGLGGTFVAGETGALWLRIHDDDSCLGDNDGSAEMGLFGPPQPANFVSLHGIAWGGNSTQFVFSPMSNIQRSRELGPLTTCRPNLSC